MKKSTFNWQLCTGLTLYALAMIITRRAEISGFLYYSLIVSALALEFWGIFRFAKSPKMKNSRFRQWKLRLIGKGDNRE